MRGQNPGTRVLILDFSLSHFLGSQTGLDLFEFAVLTDPECETGRENLKLGLSFCYFPAFSGQENGLIFCVIYLN